MTDTTYRYVNRPVALDAAPLIANADLRAAAFAHVLEIWARSERAAAVEFATHCPSLTDAQRQALVRRLSAPRDTNR